MSFITLLLLIISSAFAGLPIYQEQTIRPGEVRWIELDLSRQDVQFFCRNSPLKFYRKGEKVQAIVVENYFSELSSFACHFKNNQQVLAEIVFKVEKRDFREEKLRVNPKTIKLSAKDQERADREQLMLNKIYASSLNQLLFNTSFKGPMATAVTSVYGTRRVYNGQKKGQHLGIDYRAAIGEKVPTANAGKVVFAGDLFYTGWTVIIDHGLDIFSVYGHLSKVLVKADQFGEKGHVIGLSGNTGRTSGPHLHWGMKIQGHYIDGLVLVDETKKFFRE